MAGNVVSRILKFVKPYKRLVAGAVAGAVTSVPLGLMVPVLTGRAIDRIVKTGFVDFDSILIILLYMCAAASASALLQWMMLVCTRKLSALVVQDMRSLAFERINNAPISVIDKQRQGDVVSRLVNDADLVAEGLLQTLSQLLPGIVTIVSTIGMMLVLSVPIALAVIIATPASILFAKIVAQRTGSMFRAQNAAQGAISAHINEAVPGHDIITAFCSEENSFKEFCQLDNEYFKSNFKATFYSSISNPGTRLINAVIYAAVGVLGALLAIGGGITIGGLTAFLAYANQYTRPFNEISAVLTQMQNAAAGAERIFEVIDWQQEQENPAELLEISKAQGNVKLDDVSFSYTKKTKLIENLSINAKKGQRIALVGPTGCGKTTIINLLMRFYDVDSGSITVDNTAIDKISRDSLRNVYGMVLQDTWLKQATVFENIAYGKNGATKEQVMEAAKQAMAHKFIMRLPNGYDTVLKTGGSNLSAGQRQLICIARIMVSKPDILILDEATSSIDTRTEILVQHALEKLMEGHTSFVVAHRLSTIKNADVILVMEKGRVVERGNHQQLLDMGGAYKKLYESSFSRN